MQKIAVSFFVLAFAFTNFVGISTAQAAGAATLSLSPTNTSVKTGDSFSLSVTLSPNGESLDTVRFNLNWDASKLEAQAVDLGSLFPNLSPSNSISNTSGTLSYGAFKFGTPVTASGSIATVTFRALTSGTATIAVGSDSKLISDGVEKLNAATLGKSTITISGTDVTAKAPATSGDEVVTPSPAPTSSGSSVPTENTEAGALKYFGAFAGRLPSSAEDWAALKCIVNDGCKPAVQNIEREKKALELYTKKYGSLPTISMEWYALHAIAYTNVFIQWETPTPEPVVEPEPEPEPVVETPATGETLTLEQQAIGWFGKLTGKLPSTETDWVAVKYMVNGYTPATQDLDAESTALSLFTKTFGHLPSTSQDWNIIAAIAYSGAF